MSLKNISDVYNKRGPPKLIGCFFKYSSKSGA
nr:unnamed protein product [Callosobruchus analis]